MHVAASKAQGEAGSRLSRFVPLAVFGTIVVLFIRSCISGLSDFSIPGGGGQPDDSVERDLLTVTPDGSHGAADAARGLDDGNHGPDGSPDQPPETLDPDELWELMDPVKPTCPNRDGSSPGHLQWTESPPMCIDPTRTYIATLITDRGNIVIELDSQNEPATVNSFVFLARWHYYDGVQVHHAVRGQLIETGDPSGRPPGSGLGPGFPVEDTPMGHPGEPTDPDERAAAKSRTAGGPSTGGGNQDEQATASSTTAPPAPTVDGEPHSSPGTTRTAVGREPTPESGYPRYSVVMGSPWSRYPTPAVFFVVTAEESGLSPGPPPFGHISRGQEVVDAIDETARRRDAPIDYSLPTEPTVIHRVTIAEA